MPADALELAVQVRRARPELLAPGELLLGVVQGGGGHGYGGPAAQREAHRAPDEERAVEGAGELTGEPLGVGPVVHQDEEHAPRQPCLAPPQGGEAVALGRGDRHLVRLEREELASPGAGHGGGLRGGRRDAVALGGEQPVGAPAREVVEEERDLLVHADGRLEGELQGAGLQRVAVLHHALGDRGRPEAQEGAQHEDLEVRAHRVVGHRRVAEGSTV